MSTATVSQNGPGGDIAATGRRPQSRGTGGAPDIRASGRPGARRRGREVPRSSHAEWEPAPARRDPVAVLEEQAQTRVPELVPIRYGRMLVSPFTFYRGAAALMAADLAGCAADGAAGAALRRRAPVELRRVRGPRPAADLRRQRLRRDAARAVRVGRQAARGELRGRRARSRIRRQAARRAVNLAVGAVLPRGDARVRRDADARPLVRPPRRRRPGQALGRAGDRQAAQAASTATSPRRAPRTACGPSTG